MPNVTSEVSEQQTSHKIAATLQGKAVKHGALQATYQTVMSQKSYQSSVT